MNTKKILPKNPCSIAWMASLLVDSELSKDDVALSIAGWASDMELMKNGIFAKQVFRLGWHDALTAQGTGERQSLHQSPGNLSEHRIRRKPLPSVRSIFDIDVVSDDATVEEAEGLTSVDAH